MPDLEPITREEMLLDGQDLEPITRKEMFIKRIYDKTQVIPEPITREEMFLKKAGDETTDVTIEQLSVTENGTYSEEGKAYSPVSVNVPLPQNAYLLKSVSNLPQAIASFSDGEDMVMPSLKVAIEPIQEGSGDPSPENVRPISGHTEANVVVSPTTDAEDGQTYTIQFKDGDNPLTVYGGTLDVVSGELVVDRAMVDLGNIDYTKSQSGLFQTNEIANNVKKSSYSYAPTGFIKSSHFREIDSASITGPQGSKPSPNGVMAVSSSGTLYINYLAVTDVTDFKAAMASATLVYELATPTTIQLTPTAVKSLLGSNNVWADTGDITDAEYFSKEV
jgi:hypothetical protein